MTLTDDELREWIAKAKAATPGPWHAEEMRVNFRIRGVDGTYIMEPRNVGGVRALADAAHIAASDPPHVLAAITELLALRRDKARLDWLESHSADYVTLWCNQEVGDAARWECDGVCRPTAREAIDAAMAKGEEKGA